MNFPKTSQGAESVAGPRSPHHSVAATLRDVDRARLGLRRATAGTHRVLVLPGLQADRHLVRLESLAAEL